MIKPTRGVVSRLFPVDSTSAEASAQTLLASLSRQPTGGPLRVGDERVLDFLIAVSRRLLRPDLARRHPELGSLGFFLRRSELMRAVDSLRQGVTGQWRVPRGLVVHFPPANVDTIFVYSWALSALAGNHNIVRISARSTGASTVILDALNDIARDADPVFAETQAIVRYDHDDAITATLSAACDLRVIWGGDTAVTTIRRHPIQPLARDLSFPDRSSFAVISVVGWATATPTARRAAVEGFANDVFWFDQAACSSPRDLCWIGADAEAEQAKEEFDALLSEIVAARGWGTDHAMAIEKRVATYGLAAGGAADSVRFLGNAIANVDLAGAESWQREWLGSGTICHVTVPSLADLVPVVQRKDQTMSHFALTRAELEAFVVALAGRGVDRIVPFGRALTFAQTWDGYDLLHEFTRIVTIQT